MLGGKYRKGWVASCDSKWRCEASLIPIGSRKIVIEHNGKKKTKPYVYALTIYKSSNPERLEQFLPPVGTRLSIQAELNYRPLERPVDNKTAEERALLFVG